MTMSKNNSNIATLSNCVGDDSSHQSVVIELGLLLAAVIVSIMLSITSAALKQRRRHHRRHRHEDGRDSSEGEATTPL